MPVKIPVRAITPIEPIPIESIWEKISFTLYGGLNILGKSFKLNSINAPKELNMFNIAKIGFEKSEKKLSIVDIFIPF